MAPSSPQPIARSGSRAPQRRDSRLTYERIILAAGRLLDRHAHQEFSLAEVAREAPVSIATVYRYFGSTGQLVDAYLDDFVGALEARRAERPPAQRRGAAGLRTLGDDYVALVLARGRAMVHGRSLTGILRRHREGNADIARVWAIYAEPIETSLAELGVPATQLEFAVLLWNAMFYAREVLDLRETLGWSPPEIVGRLTAAWVAAVSQVQS